MTTTISMYGTVAYAGAFGEDTKIPLAQIIPGLDTAQFAFSVGPSATKAFPLPTSKTELRYLHLYSDKTIRVQLKDQTDATIVNLKVKGHVVLPLAPGNDLKPYITAINASATKTVELRGFFSVLPDSDEDSSFFRD